MKGHRIPGVTIFLSMLLVITMTTVLSFSALAGDKKKDADKNKDAESLSAVSVKVLEIEGDVGVTNQSGNPIPAFNKMQLHSGYNVDTQKESYAWMSLDDKKEAGLDSVSTMAVQKQGKQLVLMLDEGSMFFDVSEKLESDETMNLRTSTMVMGIKGTFGVVEAVSNLETEIVCLDGNTEINAVNPVSGETMLASLAAGERATVQLYDDGKVDVVIEAVKAEDVPGFVLAYLADNPDTVQRIEDNETGLDMESLIENADDRLEEDEKNKADQLDKIEKEAEEEKEEAEKSEKQIIPYFGTDEPDSGEPDSGEPDSGEPDNGGSGSGGNSGGGSESSDTTHTHTWTYTSDGAKTHTKTCSGCGKSVTQSHTLATTSDGSDTHTTSCSVCGYEETLSHNMVYKSQGGGEHRHVCDDCGYSDGETEYCDDYYTYTSTSSGHKGTCSRCGYSTGKEGHDWIGFEYVDTTNHRATCYCGYSELMEHTDLDASGTYCYSCDHTLAADMGGTSVKPKLLSWSLHPGILPLIHVSD